MPEMNTNTTKSSSQKQQEVIGRPEIKIIPAPPVSEYDKICCTCSHNHFHADIKRNICDIDHSYINYVQTFEGTCSHWKKGGISHDTSK